MSREVCVHGSPIDNYCPQCDAEYNAQVDAVAQRLRRAEWIRNNAAMFAVGWDSSMQGAINWAEEAADELIKRGYL